MKLTFENIHKSFAATKVVRGVNLEIRDGELFFLLGPSGCGKTTLLRMVAGFSVPDEGHVRFDTESVNLVPAEKRNTGMVFQSYALFPHMTVYENVAYGLRLRQVGGADLERRVREALDVVHMAGYGDRKPNQLSGGQQQRVALARAVVIRPRILLLDEPLSNLDARLRLDLRTEIRRILRETGITALYVTHDQEEALTMADRMGVMREGLIEQLGTPREVYTRPRTRFVAEFLGEVNFLEGEITARTSGGYSVQTPLGPWSVEGDWEDSLKGATRVLVGLRPESFTLESGANAVPGTIRDVTFTGSHDTLLLEIAGGAAWKIRLKSLPSALQPGGTLTLHASPGNVMLIPQA
ncbi:MAG: ABC transporter ATP-binding protein [Verrucomicrobiae bacterium]|nr:ABC transporter ATP-binding protein [Verrucomicrobiae bacterium]